MSLKFFAAPSKTQPEVKVVTMSNLDDIQAHFKKKADVEVNEMLIVLKDNAFLSTVQTADFTAKCKVYTDHVFSMSIYKPGGAVAHALRAKNPRIDDESYIIQIFLGEKNCICSVQLDEQYTKDYAGRKFELNEFEHCLVQLVMDASLGKCPFMIRHIAYEIADKKGFGNFFRVLD